MIDRFHAGYVETSDPKRCKHIMSLMDDMILWFLLFRTYLARTRIACTNSPCQWLTKGLAFDHLSFSNGKETLT